MKDWLLVVLFFVGFYGGLYLLGWIISKISDWFNKKREKIRDTVANELLKGTDVDSIINSYKNKLTVIQHKQTNDVERILNSYIAKRPKHLQQLGKCPKCQKGYLKLRLGQYGKFISCSLWPKCDYKTTVKKVKEEFVQNSKDSFMEDLHKAYS